MSQQINTIVFSKDKPAQLKIFLDSINKNANNIFNINVIIDYSSEEFKKGYDLVINDFKFNNINFIDSELDLKKQVISILNLDYKYFSFFLDDDILYHPISSSDIINEIELDDDVACFSLRLGKNTTYCYTLNTQNVLHDIHIEDGIMKWDWSLHYLDFGYPFAMDGHVFRKSDILKLIKKSNFNNIDELELSLFDFSETFPRNKMVSYESSVVVGVPIARVQQSIDDEMAIMLKENQTKKIRQKMNEQFLNDEFIKLESINFSEIKGCHQELNLNI